MNDVIGLEQKRKRYETLLNRSTSNQLPTVTKVVDDRFVYGQDSIDYQGRLYTRLYTD